MTLFDLSPAAPDSPGISLRPYQQGAIDSVVSARNAGRRSGLLVMPTGCGKTVVFGSLIDQIKEPALVVAHRTELLDQAAERIRAVNPGIRVGIEAADRSADSFSDVVIANVATVGRLSSKRLNWFKPRIIITDEAHHAAADGYQNVLQRFGAFEDDGPYHLGVTATPHRLDNKPLHGDHVKAIFEEIVFQYGLVDAIKDGWLCDIRGYRVKTGVDLSTVKTTAGDYNQGQLAEKVNVHARNKLAFDKWYEIAKDRRTIVFCVDVEHSKAMRDWFTERGWACEHVDGTTRADDRNAIMARFRSGATQILTNCNIATEGFDAPQIGCVLLMRPTKSWSLFVQMVGRGLRTAPGKEDCIIIDVVDTTNDHSLASIPGMFDLNPRQFSDGQPMVGGGGEEGLLFRKNLGYLEEGELVEVNLLEELQLPAPIRADRKSVV